jgi:cephalosporin hydroxylase
VLRTPVPIAQNLEEFERLLELYRERAPRRVLELGTWLGGTLYHWLTDAPAGALVVSIDAEHTTFNARRFAPWIPESVRLTLIRGRSTDPDTVAQARQLAPFEWIFIDADHHAEQVRADWLVYQQLAAPGAVVAFHDITETDDPTVEVAPLWRELRAEFETSEFCCEPGRWGIGAVYLPAG